MSRKERLCIWASKLTEDQLRIALLQLVETAIVSEDLSFYETTLAPYWTHCGDPLIDGQVTHDEED